MSASSIQWRVLLCVAYSPLLQEQAYSCFYGSTTFTAKILPKNDGTAERFKKERFKSSMRMPADRMKRKSFYVFLHICTCIGKNGIRHIRPSVHPCSVSMSSLLLRMVLCDHGRPEILVLYQNTAP